MTTVAWIAVAAIVLVAAMIAWGSFRSGFDLRHDQTGAGPAQPVVTDALLFDVGGRRSLQGDDVMAPPAPTGQARRRGPSAPVATRATVRGGPSRRSRTDAPCWICGGPRKPGCAHCQPKGPAA